MRTLERVREGLRELRARHWLLLFAYGVALYFGYHAVVGSRGLLAWRQLNEDIAATERELAAVRAERQALEDKVRRLRPDSLDPDLIDELARRHLSLAGPLDVIILLDEEDRSK
jgi:cell division protein FtsB